MWVLHFPLGEPRRHRPVAVAAEELALRSLSTPFLDRWHSIIPAAAAEAEGGTRRGEGECATHVRPSGAVDGAARDVGRGLGASGEFIEGESRGRRRRHCRRRAVVGRPSSRSVAVVVVAVKRSS